MCHWVFWEKISRPKKEGGVGFHNLCMLNRAYMHKLALKMVADPDKHWVHVMRAKYKCGSLSMHVIILRNNSSNFWKSISMTWVKVKQHTRWV